MATRTARRIAEAQAHDKYFDTIRPTLESIFSEAVNLLVDGQRHAAPATSRAAICKVLARHFAKAAFGNAAAGNSSLGGQQQWSQKSAEELPSRSVLAVGAWMQKARRSREAAQQRPAAASTAGGGALRLDVSELQLGRSLASGAEAEVCRGVLWGQLVAVKQLKPVRDDGHVKAASTIAAELLHETKVLSQLHHPRILSLIGFTDVPAQIVLEQLEGTIYDLIGSGALETRVPGGVLRPLGDVAAAMSYLHALDPPILHRDLKPPNVLYDGESYRCKICDFGTALALHPTTPATPPPTEWAGSALYVAPEVDSEQPYGLPADIFSFGVMSLELLHQIATGSTYYGDGDMFMGGGLLEGLETLRGPLVAEPPQQPIELRDECGSEALWRLLMECVASDPAKRPVFKECARRLSECEAKAAST